MWSYGYILLFLLACGCAAIIWRVPQTVIQPAYQLREEEAAPDETGESARSSVKRRFRWVVLAFVPASLTLGITTALTTELPPIPLLWVLPRSEEHTSELQSPC